ncbi:PREDICTED: bactericidal permeability-increasing protein-like isoform X2 [Pseudopodoces humilis]|uniref:bactericidal permeability-increasing protein-like isoform X2 n=1 Tax=Pseudopodoces humilis TaxID=181119 RepID=UPI0003957960|nr:PREDICTED: bactericidal permeability-increasing protein-like isoform X2 [Pseudopodoces humilis]
MGVQSLAVACGALALCLALTTATNPGFVVRITQAGLDYAHEHGITVLEKQLAQLKLPDISGDSRVLRVGKVHYEISRLRLRDFHLPYTRITPISNVGLQVSISNAFAELDGDWRVKFLFVRDHGSFNLKVENVYIKIILRLGSDTTGKPTISTSDCSARISKVRVLFSGRLGWLYNLFHSVIESKMRKNLESKVCDNVAKSVQNELQTYIQTLPVTARIDAKIGLDYALVAPPRATAQSLDAGLKGEFYSLAHRSTVPFSPPPLVFPPDHDRMVYFGASSYFFNTACIAYHKAGALVFEITEAMIPKDVGFKLDTSVFSAFIPQLEEMYPDMPMKFRLSAPTAPFLTIGPGGISFQPVVDAQAYAILPNSSLAPLFLLSLTGNVSAVVNVRSGRIVGSLDVGRIRLSLKDSTVGTFQVRMMQSLMNALTSSTLIPRLNARLDEGFPLPLLDRIQLSNTLVKFYQNFMLLGADVHFQPQA